MKCTACQVVLGDSREATKAHYSAPFHRYNLKRRSAGLRPSTEEEFERKLEILTKREGGETACETCDKRFETELLLKRHLGTKKHINNVAKREKAGKSSTLNERRNVEITDPDLKGEPDLDPVACIFCNTRAPDLHTNCNHMRIAHGFFLPDAEHIFDLEGLIRYCAEKVKVGFYCLWCNDTGKTFKSWRAAQQHMLDMGHCKLQYQDGVDLHEFEPFYDDDLWDADEEDKNMKDSEVDEDWEGSESDLERKRGSSMNMRVNEFGELELGNCGTRGHQQYRKYYRQNLGPHKERKAGPSRLMIMGGDPVQLNGLGGNERRSNSGSQVVMRGPGGITGLGGKNDIRMLKSDLVQKPEFQHILRVLNTNIDGRIKVMYALTKIPGVGRRFANLICKKAEVDYNKRAGELTPDEIEKLVAIIQDPRQYKVPDWFLNRQRDWKTGKSSQAFAQNMATRLREDLERLKKIRCHRGIRHYWGVRVRGQHTKTTGRHQIARGPGAK